jgi:hypothetical protein
VVDGRRQGAEERVEAVGIQGVERRVPLRADVRGGAPEALRIPAREDDLRALGAGGPGRLEPDAGAAADEDDGLVEQGRLAHGGRAVGKGGHDVSDLRADAVTGGRPAPLPCASWSAVIAYSRPGRRLVISCTIQPLPSGSSKDRNDP